MNTQLPYVIAEIGFNHQGSVPVAREMIRAAARSGANAVKFQTFRAKDLVLPGSDHYALIQNAEMDLDMHLQLRDEAMAQQVVFISTPFSLWAVDLLETVGVPAYKIASMDCTHRPLLHAVAQTRKPIYLSTGMADLHEIHRSISYLKAEGSGPVTLLHCVSHYPCRAEELNLDLIPLLKRLFRLPVGYSDHYAGIEACLLSAVLGAEIIETHFTLDHGMEGPDHQHSLEPGELETLIKTISLLKIMRGDATAALDKPDRQVAGQFRRGIYAKTDLKKGHRLRLEDLLLVRPETDIRADRIDEVIGRRTTREIPAHAGIHQCDIG
jgi:sialic acid synthase SpsE